MAIATVSAISPILDQLNLRDVVSWSQVNRDKREFVKWYMRDRIDRMLSYWMRKTGVFRCLLREAQAAVAGSVALGVCMDDVWLPNTLDIYTRRGWSGPVVHFFEEEGYTVTEYVISICPYSRS